MLCATAACDRRPDDGAVVASVIGRPGDLRLPPRYDDTLASAVLRDALGQGLVGFDETGQIEGGLAERWIVSDNGRSYIFRLGDAQWPDGKKVEAGDVATILRRRIAAGSGNPLLPYLSAIDSVVAMTPEVLEIGLNRSRPDLLKLLAHPDMAIVRRSPPGGTGPFRVTSRTTGTALLTPVPVANGAEADDAAGPLPQRDVRLFAEPAARAVARFAAKQSDLVLGGTFDDWPVVNLADVAPSNRQIDPATGLFGLAVVSREGFLATPENRGAIAQAIDRVAITALFADGWQPRENILPADLDSAAPPALPTWSATDLADRRAAARAQVAAWIADEEAGERPIVRIALPNGPGGTLLWGRLAADLIAIGVEPIRVGPEEAGDLRLVDRVAPYDGARWYLLTACGVCAPLVTDALEASRVAPTNDLRMQANAIADAALAQDNAFIMIAAPLRWSLVALRLRAWQANARAWHPLNRLRRDPN